MTNSNKASESESNLLCKSCGLCCTGYLFAWTKLRSAELDSIQSLGVNVFREPNQRGFNQPCPLWNGICTIYTSPHYPRFCHTYKCKLLKDVLDESIPLEEALDIVELAKELIRDLESFLPDSMQMGFREWLITKLDDPHVRDTDPQFKQKAEDYLAFCEKHFGVQDFLPHSIE
jgi:hypothetical protein